MNKKLIILTALFAVCGTTMMTLALTSSNNLPSVDAVNEHDEHCLWNHYDEIEATILSHGSKEFWACCSHQSFVLTEPTSGTIHDAGAFSGEYFDNLDELDDRYIAPLEGTVITFDELLECYDNKPETPYTNVTITKINNGGDPIVIENSVANEWANAKAEGFMPSRQDFEDSSSTSGITLKKYDTGYTLDILFGGKHILMVYDIYFCLYYVNNPVMNRILTAEWR